MTVEPTIARSLIVPRDDLLELLIYAKSLQARWEYEDVIQGHHTPRCVHDAEAHAGLKALIARTELRLGIQS